jgi:fatty acid desaturase
MSGGGATARGTGGLDRLIPESTNLRLSGLALAGHALVLVFSPMAWNHGWIAFGPLLALFGYLSFLSWLLIHEAIHMKLARPRRRNDAAGRLLAIAFGCPMHILKVGHMAHHRYNRGELDTTEFMPEGARFPAVWWLHHYGKILGGLYVAEVLAPLAFFFWSRLRRLAAVKRSASFSMLLTLFTPRMVNAVRADALASLGLVGVLIYAYWGALLPLALLYGCRALVISYHDNLYHYGTEPHGPLAARNLAVPGWLSPLMLHHHLHRVHHDVPVVSWKALPVVFRSQERSYDGSLAGTGLLQLRGPVRAKSEGPQPS